MNEEGRVATDLELAKKAVEYANLLILISKAKGGWKIRQQIRLSDHELAELMPKVETDLVLMAARMAVAEKMIGEHPPSIHPRMDEYAQRVEDVLKGMGMIARQGAEHVAAS